MTSKTPSNLKELLEQTLQQAEMKAWSTTPVDIEHTGRKITLPAEPGIMPIPAAIEALQELEKQENQRMDVKEIIEAFPLDGAVALCKAMKEVYGWVTPVPHKSFFGDINPDMITVEVDHGKYIQVPWGKFKLPNIQEPIATGATMKGGLVCLIIYGTCTKREKEFLLQLAQKTREILKKESIYKGKALRFCVNEEGEIDFNEPPKFLDMDSVSKEELILSRDVEAQVKTSILTPIMFTEECVKHKIPLNRGVLLEGPYGTGKTLTALTTAKASYENGWTFILLDRVQGLREALLFAQRYAPAVVFAEDIDRLMEERDENANDLLNTIDGVVTKGAKVITILTTNHIEKIHQAMLRPGRFDAVISVQPPDAEAVERLVALYSRGLLAEGEDLKRVGDLLAGQIPATIREVVERSKLGMIGRGDKVLRADDLETAANSMRNHLMMLNRSKEEPTAAERLASSLRDVISGVEDLDLENMDKAAAYSQQGVSISRKNHEMINENTRHVRALGDKLVQLNEHFSEQMKLQNSKLEVVAKALKSR